MGLLTCWLGFGQVGLAPSVLTHWVTATSFMGLLPIPRSRAYLGATTAWFGVVMSFALDLLLCQDQTPRHFPTFERCVGRVNVRERVGTGQEFIEQELARLIHLEQIQNVNSRTR